MTESSVRCMPTIRELRPEELPGCVNLLRAAFGTVAREFGLTKESAPTNAAFATLENLTWHMDDGMAVYGMFVDSLLVGCVAIKKAKKDETVYYIERLAVAPEQRHGGLGDQLLSFALARIRKNGGATASIGLMDNNRRLKEWYRSKGFVQKDRRRVAHLPFKVCYMSIDARGGSGV